MTVIAFDGRQMAADKRCCTGGMVRTVTKIRRVGQLLVGGSGEASFIGNMIDWIKNGRDPATFPASQKDKDDWQPIMVVEPSGQILIYERTPHPIRWENKVGAIGSGRDFAEAAMYLGKTAKEAVAVASALDAGCGNGVDVLNLL